MSHQLPRHSPLNSENLLPSGVWTLGHTSTGVTTLGLRTVSTIRLDFNHILSVVSRKSIGLSGTLVIPSYTIGTYILANHLLVLVLLLPYEPALAPSTLR